MVGMTLPGCRRQVPGRSYFDTDVTQVTRVAFIRSLRIRVTAVTGPGTGNSTAPVAIAKVGQIDTTTAAQAAPFTRRLANSLRAAAPLLLAVSVAARLAWTYLAPNGANFVDLHVYLGGAAAIDHPGTLYSYVYADQTPDFPLPFTYPPFAAVVFYPLHLLPVGASRCCGRRSPSGSSRCAARSTTGRSMCCSCWGCCGRSTRPGGGYRACWSVWRPESS